MPYGMSDDLAELQVEMGRLRIALEHAGRERGILQTALEDVLRICRDKQQVRGGEASKELRIEGIASRALAVVNVKRTYIMTANGQEIVVQHAPGTVAKLGADGVLTIKEAT